MNIFTIWEKQKDNDDDMPWLVDMIDEYTVEESGEFPESYIRSKMLPERREIIITVPDKAILDAFEITAIKGTVVKSDV